jgi:type III pantothenate kinase
VLLAIDVGNTQTHIGVFRGDELAEDWRIATARESTADELATGLSSLLGLRDLGLRDVGGAIVSSVVPQLTPQYERLSERYLRGALVVVSPAIRSGMPIRIEKPHELGTDRLLNAVAAWDRHHRPCVVVDFGTTINFDVVSARGEFLGGIFAPGIEISMEALSTRAAKLLKVDLEPPHELIGRSTEAALRSGIVYGFAGAVDGIVSRVRGELGPGTVALATGGLAGAIVPFCEQIDGIDPYLTLTGLRLVWERNQG